MDTHTSTVMTIPGSVSVEGDADPLRVRLVVSNDRISLRSGEAELGSWALASVDVAPTRDGSFDFTADGETIRFMPDEPDAFSQLAMITTRTTRRSRRRRKAESAKPAAAPAPPQPRPAVRSERPKASVPRSTAKQRRDAGRATSEAAQRMASGAVKRAWLFTLDRARDKNLFGLDRVQVTDEMRADEDHEHTWDRRIANGLAKHICTACGKVRLKAD
jgi:hypothetical protein